MSDVPSLSKDDSIFEPRKSRRARKENRLESDVITAFLSVPLLIDDNFLSVFILENILNYDEVMRSFDAIFSKEANNSELESILNNNTLYLGIG